MPLVFDWRDHEAFALLMTCCPAVACADCAEPVALNSPIVVLRPGDPVGCLLSLPVTNSVERDVAAVDDLMGTVKKLAPDLAIGSVARTSHTELVGMATRYTGFALASVGHDGSPLKPPADDWLIVIRPQLAVPDLTAALTELLEAPDEESSRIWARHPALLDPAWAPVLAAIKQPVLSRLPDPDDHRVARRKLVELNRRRWPRDPVPRHAFDELDEDTRRLVEQASSPDVMDVAGQRAVLDQLTKLVEDGQVQSALLAEYLMVFLIKIYETATHDAERVELAIAAGRVVVPLAEKTFGEDHPMTLITMQDYAAALLDRQRSDADASRETAIEVLTTAARRAATANDRALPDIVQNLATAYAHRQRGGRVHNQQLADDLCVWAIHLIRTLTPLNTKAITLGQLTLASIRRERRLGDRHAAAAEARAIFAEILAGPRAESLEPDEEVTTQANFATALYQLWQLDHESVKQAEVVTVARLAAQTAGRLPVGHPARVLSLSNAASILGDLYHENGFGELELLNEAVELTGTAYREATSNHGPDHPEALRTGFNYAAMLGMPVREASTVRLFDVVRAEALLRELLTNCPVDRLPAHTTAIANNLGRLLCGTGRWLAACEAFRTAMAAVDSLYREAQDPESQLAELGVAAELSWSTLSGWLVSAALEAGDTAGALATIERTRGRLLADRLHATTLAPAPGPAPSDGAVLYIGVSALRSWVILVPPRGRTTFYLSTLTASGLRPAVNALRRAPDSDKRSHALGALSTLVRDHITAPAYALLAEHSVTDVGIVSSGLLSGVPIHVLPASENDECLLDLATVRYLPSAAIVRHIEARPPSRRRTAVAIAHPELRSFARHEAQLLEQAYERVLVGPATGDLRAWLLEHVADAAHLLLSCHARWLERDPLRSPIYLDDRNPVLLADLLSVDQAPDVVVISSCETGVTAEPLADEILGFGTAMLLAGARATVVSNWRLGDRLSALVLAVLYQEIAGGADLATALRVGQLWVARLTVTDLVALGEGQPAGGRSLSLPADIAHELKALRFSALRRDPQHRPYADPASWGGFSYFGARVGQDRELIHGAA